MVTRPTVGFMVLALLFALCIAGSGFAQPAAQAADGWGRHIVTFEQGFPSAASQAALVRAFGGAVVRDLAIINGAAVALPPGIAKQLARRGEVLRVEVDAEVRALGKPSSPPGQSKPKDEDPSQVLPWGVDRIDAEWAWVASKGSGVRVAVIDTGIDNNHPDLAVAGGTNFVSKVWFKPADPNKWDDDNGHGTHVAGIITALDNSTGVVGVAPEASLYAVKALDRTGSGYVSDIIAGIQWAGAQGMDIVNMSLGTDSDVAALHEACDIAADAGLLLVAAAGNDGLDVDYPGAYDSVIAVAATDSADSRPWWSSPGAQVYIAAPGVEVYSTLKDGGYGTKSGTSMATPHISGALALALAAGASLDLCSTAADLPPAGLDIYTGCGLVDAEKAVTGTDANGDDLP